MENENMEVNPDESIDLPDNLEAELSKLTELLDIKDDDGSDEELEISPENPTDSDEYKNRKDTYVRVSDDRREAWLFLEVPTRRAYTVDSVLDLLKMYNVKAGYIMSNIKAMVKKGVYERAILVAKAKDPEEGHDGFYLYGFDEEAINRKTPKILADGSVDYKSMNLTVSVGKDQLLARYFPKEEGKNGYLIDGSPLPCKAVKDLSTIKGKGFYFNEETQEYFSSYDGNLDFKENSYLDVRNVFEIKGDVNQLNGALEFKGDIHILGNVESGTTIKAGGTVSIDGVVEACEIIAGGDIVLRRGIQGGNEGLIVSGGTVFSNFIDHTTVRAAVDVNSNTILNSTVTVNGKVIVNGKKGHLVGGYTHARKGIHLSNLGNDSEVKTVVHVGLEEKDLEKNQALIKRDRQLREALTPIVGELTRLVEKSKTRKLLPEEAGKIKVLIKEKDNLVASIKTCAEEKTKIDAVISDAEGACVVVTEHVYKGVTVGIDSQNLVIPENTRSVVYDKKHGTINSSAYVWK